MMGTKSGTASIKIRMGNKMEDKLASELKIEGVRYWETRNGVGYEAKTQYGSIWNDGNGGNTYFENSEAEHSKYRNIHEQDLEEAINKYEGIDALFEVDEGK